LVALSHQRGGKNYSQTTTTTAPTINDKSAIHDRDMRFSIPLGIAKFLTHLSHWIPDFCAKVRERAELPFYRVIATLTSDFILSEVTTPSAGFIDC